MCELPDSENVDTININEFSVDSKNKFIYFCEIHESGGGQSYHNVKTISAFESENDVYKEVDIYYNHRHNLSDECKKCKGINSDSDSDRECDQSIIDKQLCKNKMFDDLKKTGWTQLGITGCEGADIYIYKFQII